jgi:hypothetical protein
MANRKDLQSGKKIKPASAELTRPVERGAAAKAKRRKKTSQKEPANILIRPTRDSWQIDLRRPASSVMIRRAAGDAELVLVLPKLGYGTRRRFGSLQKVFFKTFCMYLLIAMNWMALSGIVRTGAFFSDTQNAAGNIFSATNLGLSLELFSHDGFRTQSQGGWGSPPRGDNPGAYLEANFSLVWPAGLQIGSSTGWTAFFASSADVRRFLPAGGPPDAFDQNHSNPKSTEAGNLAGQVLALALSLGFDEYDPDFSANSRSLSTAVVNGQDSPCAGLSVREVFDIANAILSGHSESFSPALINDCVTEINEKFIDGSSLDLTPFQTITKEIIVKETGQLEFQHRISTEYSDGDEELCQALVAEVFFEDQPAYRGELLRLSVLSRNLVNGQGVWRFNISLPDDASPELVMQACSFRYIVNGWQKDIGAPGGGFFDIKELADEVKSGEWDLLTEQSPEAEQNKEDKAKQGKEEPGKEESGNSHVIEPATEGGASEEIEEVKTSDADLAGRAEVIVNEDNDVVNEDRDKASVSQTMPDNTGNTENNNHNIEDKLLKIESILNEPESENTE